MEGPSLGSGPVGSGLPVMGINRVQPAKAIREAIVVIRKLWRGEVVDFDGEVVQCRNGRLSFPSRADIPIVVATRGDLVLRTAGEVADGVMIATYVEPEGRHGGRDRPGRRRPRNRAGVRHDGKAESRAVREFVDSRSRAGSYGYLEKSNPSFVMHSIIAGWPDLVISTASLSAGTKSAGFSTRTPQLPRALATSR